MHITRQVTVQAVMLGEGVVNCLNPTSGVLMGVLAKKRDFLWKMDSFHGSTCTHLVYHWTCFSYCWGEY